MKYRLDLQAQARISFNSSNFIKDLTTMSVSKILETKKKKFLMLPTVANISPLFQEKNKIKQHPRCNLG